MTNVQITTIFLIRRRRFFASICCLYRSGRYIEPVSFGFLFTTAASNDYLLLCSLPVKKERGLKRHQVSGMSVFSLLVKACREKKKRSEKGRVILLANLQYALPTSVGLPCSPQTIHMPSVAGTYCERTLVPRILAFVFVSIASPHSRC